MSVCLESLVKISLHPLNHHVIESLIFAEWATWKHQLMGRMVRGKLGPEVVERQCLVVTMVTVVTGDRQSLDLRHAPAEKYSVDVDDFQVVSESQRGGWMHWHHGLEGQSLSSWHTSWAGHAYQSAGGQPAKGNVSCFLAGEMEHLCGLQLGQQRITSCDRSPSPPDWSLNVSATGRIERLPPPKTLRFGGSVHLLRTTMAVIPA